MRNRRTHLRTALENLAQPPASNGDGNEPEGIEVVAQDAPSATSESPAVAEAVAEQVVADAIQESAAPAAEAGEGEQPTTTPSDAPTETVAIALEEPEAQEESLPEEVEAIRAEPQYPGDPDDDGEGYELADIVSEMSDMRGDAQEMEENCEDIRGATEAADELEDLAQHAEKTPDSEAARVLLEVAVENIYDRLGIENPHMALEDAGGIASTVAEKARAIREGMVKLLRALLEAIKKAVEKVRAYLRRVFAVAARVEKNALELAALVKKSHDGFGSGTIQSKQLTNRLAVTRQATFMLAFQHMEDLVQDAYKSARSGYIEHFTKAIKIFTDGGHIEHLHEEIPTVLAHAFHEALPNTNSGPVVDVIDSPSGVDVFSSDIMPGNYVGVLMLPKDTANLAQLDYEIHHIDKDNESMSLPVLNKDEALKVLAGIVKTCSLIRRFDRDVNAHDSFIKQVEESIRHLDKKMEGEVTQEDRDFIRTIGHMAGPLARGIHERTFAFATETCAATLRYVEASMHADAAHDRKAELRAKAAA